MDPENLNCPSCAAPLPQHIATTNLICCDYCDTLVFRDTDTTRYAGKKGTIAKFPSLIEVGRDFVFRNITYQPVGQIRLEYNKGFWDEFWVIDHKGKAFWLSVDEGDLAFELPLSAGSKWLSTPFAKLKLGSSHPADKNYKITELGHATCVAVAGSIPEKLLVGSSYNYAHLQKGPDLITIEFDTDQQSEPTLTSGHWVDPYEVFVK